MRKKKTKEQGGMCESVLVRMCESVLVRDDYERWALTLAWNHILDTKESGENRVK